MSATDADDARRTAIALFPLHTVLYPGGALPLRIFETRYVDMVRDCMRASEPFGVVPILEGSEVGTAPHFHASGTLAEIESWDQGEDGLLRILARGTHRFTVLDHTVREDGLVVASLALRGEQATPVAPEFGFLRELLANLFDARPELAPVRPWHLDDAGWLAYRFAELLPLDASASLVILDRDEAADKLAVIAHVIESANTPRDDPPRH